MTSVTTPPHLAPTGSAPRPSARITALAGFMAAACLAFAAVNVSLETSGSLAGDHVEYADALTAMNWFVIALKVVGAAVAVLSVLPPRRGLLRTVLGSAVWAAFATLAFYAAGNVLQLVGILAGLMGSRSDLDLRSVAYVVGFVAAAAGFGALARSYSRQVRLPRRAVVLGLLAGPATIGVILVAMPALLRVLGVMPSS